MTANVDPIAFVVHGPGDSAHIAALFEDNRLDPAAREELIGGRQPRGACADDDCPLLVHKSRSELERILQAAFRRRLGRAASAIREAIRLNGSSISREALQETTIDAPIAANCTKNTSSSEWTMRRPT